MIGMADLIGTLLGILLTLFVFSYILGDNVLFRVATYLFIGSAAGYAAVIAWYNVIWPHLLSPLVFGSQPERLFVLFTPYNSQILFQEDWVYMCLHPDSPRVIVEMVFSERGLPGESDATLMDVRERFFKSLQFRPLK